MQVSVAQRWIRRWDAQQERYIADREGRFRVVGDVVDWALRDTPGGRVVDLGCGPGSLGARLVATRPGVEVVGVDADPLLLGLAEAGAGVRVVRADLTDPGWPDALGLDGPWDAAVSSTALHWLAPDDLAALYATVAARLRSGGVFVDADHRALDDPAAADLARYVRSARATRAGVDDNEDWRSWWEAALADDDLAPLLEARSREGAAHSAESSLTLGQQAALLREAGFATAAPVWQSGDDVVLVAIR
jgi:SAM-dependent methyltransferase